MGAVGVIERAGPDASSNTHQSTTLKQPQQTGWGESGDGALIGNVTNIHITDVDIDGPVPRCACARRAG
jgi:hypothetical protein